MSATAASLLSGREPVVVRPDLCVRDVARCLREAGAAVAVVVRGGVVAGIVSERDVVAALAHGGDPDLVWAADVMTGEPVWAEADDPAERVLELLCTAGVRHLPVLDDGNLVGVVGMEDVVAALLDPGRRRDRREVATG